MSDASVTVDFTSHFYGHDSAIDRDLVQYGWKYSMPRENLNPEDYKGDFFLVEVTGDNYQDMAVYTDDVLTIYPAVLNTKKRLNTMGKHTIPFTLMQIPNAPSALPWSLS